MRRSRGRKEVRNVQMKASSPSFTLLRGRWGNGGGGGGLRLKSWVGVRQWNVVFCVWVLVPRGKNARGTI